MNSQMFDAPLPELQNQAIAALTAGEYEQAGAIYEHLIEIEPENRECCWLLGLARLLSGYEVEAQLTWSLTIAEAPPEQTEQWTIELFAVLEAVALEQEAIGKLANARLIRQHQQQIDPAEINNLLRLIQIELQLGQFSPDDLETLGLVQQLQMQPSVDANLLLLTLEKVLDFDIASPATFRFAEACLPHVQEAQQLIQILLPRFVAIPKQSGDFALACRYGELCLQLDSNHAAVLMRLANFYFNDYCFDRSIELAKRYSAQCQTLIQTIGGNALLLRNLMAAGSRWQEAEAVMQQEMELLQTWVATHPIDKNQYIEPSILCGSVYFFPYLRDDPAQTRPLQNQVAALYQACLRGYAEQHFGTNQSLVEARSTKTPAIETRSPALSKVRSRKLRIGYLSCFLHRHSVGWLARWLFEYFDRDRFEVFVYFSQQTQLNAFSKQWFADKATQFRTIEGDFWKIAETIQRNEIDILVDLDSLTAYSTCGVMALKPAPVQVTWLGWDATGLPAVDYFIADPYVLPEAAQTYYAEKIWRLPKTYIAVNGFEVGTPTLRRDLLNIPMDAVLYFSSQMGQKRNPQNIRLQLQILKQVPNSYFLIKGIANQQSVRVLFEQLAEAEGVSRDRLRFLPPTPDEETHRANLAIADIVLDTFPYNGATTTLETLWMGIPLVTRVGQQFASRNSYTMMTNAGISEGIAWSDREYIEWGVRLGNDAALRQQISWRMKQSRQTAPLWDAKQFTCEMEKAYEQMWEIYLATT